MSSFFSTFRFTTPNMGGRGSFPFAPTAQRPYFHHDSGAPSPASGTRLAIPKVTVRASVWTVIDNSDQSKTLRQGRRIFMESVTERVNALPQRFRSDDDPLRQAHELGVTTLNAMQDLLEQNATDRSLQTAVWRALVTLNDLVPPASEETIKVLALQRGFQRTLDALPLHAIRAKEPVAAKPASDPSLQITALMGQIDNKFPERGAIRYSWNDLARYLRSVSPLVIPPNTVLAILMGIDTRLATSFTEALDFGWAEWNRLKPARSHDHTAEEAHSLKNREKVIQKQGELKKRFSGNNYPEATMVIDVLTLDHFTSWELTLHLRTFEEIATGRGTDIGFLAQFVAAARQEQNQKIRRALSPIRANPDPAWQQIQDLMDRQLRILAGVDAASIAIPGMIRLLNVYHRFILVLEHCKTNVKPYNLTATQTQNLIRGLIHNYHGNPTAKIIEKNELMDTIYRLKRENGLPKRG